MYKSLVAPTSTAPTKGSRTGIRGVPIDLADPRDNVPDVLFGGAGVAATRTAAIGPRPADTALTGLGCMRAVDTYAKSNIARIAVGEAICVRTSHGGVAAVTLTAADRIDWLYWMKTQGQN